MTTTERLLKRRGDGGQYLIEMSSRFKDPEQRRIAYAIGRAARDEARQALDSIKKSREAQP